MSGTDYRPITEVWRDFPDFTRDADGAISDVWILARSKTKYYGAFPAGSLHRMRQLLAANYHEPVLHVCGGKIREYPFRGLGKNDKTLDLDPELKPDFLQDARDELPWNYDLGYADYLTNPHAWRPWRAILIDRPYTEDDATHYAPGPVVLPDLNDLLKRSLQRVAVGGHVGVLDYLWPHPGKYGKEVAVVAVGTGRNSRARWFTVFERLPETV